MVIQGLDGIGAKDIAIRSMAGSVVLWNKGNGPFPSPTTYTIANRPWRVVSADANGDSKWALFSACYICGQSMLLTATGNRTLQESVIETGTGTDFLAVTDMNADGFVDVVALGGRRIAIIPNSGTGSYAFPQLISNGNRPHGIVATDVDGDTDVDLIVANSDDANIGVRINQGGVFAPQVT